MALGELRGPLPDLVLLTSFGGTSAAAPQRQASVAGPITRTSQSFPSFSLPPCLPPSLLSPLASLFSLLFLPYFLFHLCHYLVSSYLVFLLSSVCILIPFYSLLLFVSCLLLSPLPLNYFSSFVLLSLYLSPLHPHFLIIYSLLLSFSLLPSFFSIQYTTVSLPPPFPPCLALLFLTFFFFLLVYLPSILSISCCLSIFPASLFALLLLFSVIHYSLCHISSFPSHIPHLTSISSHSICLLP